MMYLQPLHIGLICVDVVSLFSSFLIISAVNSLLAVANVSSAVSTGPVFVIFSTVGMLHGVLAEATEPLLMVPRV